MIFPALHINRDITIINNMDREAALIVFDLIKANLPSPIRIYTLLYSRKTLTDPNKDTALILVVAPNEYAAIDRAREMLREKSGDDYWTLIKQTSASLEEALTDSYGIKVTDILEAYDKDPSNTPREKIAHSIKYVLSQTSPSKKEKSTVENLIERFLLDTKTK